MSEMNEVSSEVTEVSTNYNVNANGTVTPMENTATPMQAPAQEDRPSDYSEAAAKRFASAPWALVSRDGTIPEQLYNFKITESYAAEDNNEDPAKRRFIWVTVNEITSPVEMAGRLIVDRFYIGTADDPKAESDATFQTSPAAGNLMNLCDHCGVADQPAKLVGKEFAAFTRTSEPNAQGRKFSNISHAKHFAIGVVAPGTPSEKQANTSQRYRKSAAGASVATTDPNALSSCPLCSQQFATKDMIDHLRGCKVSSVTV